MFNRTKINPQWALGNVGDLLSGTTTTEDQELGTELELEGSGFDKLKGLFSAWDCKSDGSLKNSEPGHTDQGAEFVLKQPLHRDKVKQCLNEFYAVAKIFSKIELSHRCSTHLHLNFQHMNINQVYLFLTNYYLLEMALFHAFAPNRLGNRFCLPLAYAETIADNLAENLKTNVFSKGTGAHEKYAAMNTAALAKYGSLESRMLGGTDDPAELIRFIDVLLELYDHAKTNVKMTPTYFLGQFSGRGYRAFVEGEFPKTWAAIKDVPKLDRLLEMGVETVQPVVYAVDWTPVIDASIPKKVRKVDPSKYVHKGHTGSLVSSDDYVAPAYPETVEVSVTPSMAITQGIVLNSIPAGHTVTGVTMSPNNLGVWQTMYHTTPLTIGGDSTW